MTDRASGAERAARPLGEPVPLWRSAAFLIMVITGLFHIGRRAPVDGVIFLGVAAALAATRRWHRDADGGAGTVARPHPAGARWTGLVLVGCLAYGWVVGHLVPASVPVKIAIIIPGLVMLRPALRAAWTRVDRPPVRSGWWAWALVGLLICLWELATFLQQPSPTESSYDHPTLSVVLEPLFADAPLRSALLAGWLLAGALLLRLLAGVLRSRR